MRSVAQTFTVALVVVVALGGLSTVAVADTGEPAVERIGSVDIEIADEHVQVDGLEISGDGLPSMSVDERTYEIDSLSMQTDGFTVEFSGTTYEFCSVDITLENVGVTVTDSSVNGE